jgi:hypothetical protein
MLNQTVDLAILLFFTQAHLVHLLFQKSRNRPESILPSSAPL